MIHYRYNIYLFIKALQKAEFSEFRIFAKIETRFIMYSAFSILRQNQILRNTKHMTKLMKMTKNGSKTLFLGQKQGFLNIQNIRNIRNIRNLFFSVFRIYRITS